MGLSVDDDVDEAVAPAFDYHDIFANPRDDEAPLVWGYRAPSRWSRMSDEDRFHSLAFIAMCIAIALLGLWVGGIYWYAQVLNSPSFSVALAGYDGIDPGSPGRVVSPAFDVTLRMNRTCVDRADVVVSYTGVALGWARAEPWDCAEKRRAKDIEVVARGGGVGLLMHLRYRYRYRLPGMSVAKVRFVAAGAGLGMPESLYESLEAQRGRRERVQLTVRVRLDEDRLLPHHVPDASRFAASLVSGGDAGWAPPERAVTLHGIQNVVKLEHETVGPLIEDALATRDDLSPHAGSNFILVQPCPLAPKPIGLARA